MSPIKKFISFFWDIPIEKSGSLQNEYLEVVWSQGVKMLNTRNANYSFGTGYQVFEFAFNHLDKILADGLSVLVLGFGCGSIEHILKEKRLNPKITGIEYDPEIVRLYKKHFMEEESKVELICDDASNYLKTCNEQFDLVIIDLFDDLQTVPLTFDKEFTTDLRRVCKEDGALVYNTVINSQQSEEKARLITQLKQLFANVNVLATQKINEVIIAN